MLYALDWIVFGRFPYQPPECCCRAGSVFGCCQDPIITDQSPRSKSIGGVRTLFENPKTCFHSAWEALLCRSWVARPSMEVWSESIELTDSRCPVDHMGTVGICANPFLKNRVQIKSGHNSHPNYFRNLYTQIFPTYVITSSLKVIVLLMINASLPCRL